MKNDDSLAPSPSGECAVRREGAVRRVWERWLDFWHGKEKCPYGKRRGAHEWFYLNCEGCRADWLEEIERDAVARANQRAAREREERISQMVEALRQFTAEGHQLPQQGQARLADASSARKEE